MNILITGGASGLGRAIVVALSQNKMDQIYFTFRSAHDESKELEAEFSNCSGCQIDFNNTEDVHKLSSKIAEWDIDVLINNAHSGFEKKHFARLNLEVAAGSFMTNVLSTLQITQSALKYFKTKKFGKIITILSSAIINVPPIGWSYYVAEKNYLLSMSKTWATEGIKSNISSNSISPSFMLTNMNEDLDARIIEQKLNAHPLKEFLPVKEVARAVNYIIRSSQHLNGQNIIINTGEALS